MSDHFTIYSINADGSVSRTTVIAADSDDARETHHRNYPDNMITAVIIRDDVQRTRPLDISA